MSSEKVSSPFFRVTGIVRSREPLKFNINGDNAQILRTLQDQIDYLREKVGILEEIIEAETGREQPVFSEDQKRRLAHRGRKLNKYLLSVIEQTYAPGTIHDWYRELVGKKYDSTGEGQRKRGRKPISPEIVEKVLFFNERNPDWGYDRIAGTMKYLGYDVSATTIRKILNATGLFPTRNAGNAATGSSSSKPSSTSQQPRTLLRLSE